MNRISRDFFLFLSKNKMLNNGAKRWGFRLGASKVVAGTDVNSAMKTIQALNKQGLKCTVDHLGEFVTQKEEALEAKRNCINTLHAIAQNQVDCHLSIKLTQLGLDIDKSFCLNNVRDILHVAHQHNIYINIDMEDYAHYQPTLDLLRELRKAFSNVGTVIQSYLYRAEQDLDELIGTPLRIVKGAYKETPDIAMQSKDEIDENFLKLIKKHLSSGSFTSIATHDHHIIEQIISFTEDNNIPKETFEYQMLYGFRTDLQLKLAEEGYNFCTYVPFGNDWYGYFMRRLAERPQNLNFVVKGIFSK